MNTTLEPLGDEQRRERVAEVVEAEGGLVWRVEPGGVEGAGEGGSGDGLVEPAAVAGGEHEVAVGGVGGGEAP